jgi:hypothetical protein
MHYSSRWIILIVFIIAGLQLSACRQDSETNHKIDPAHVEHIEGSDLSRVTLTPKAMVRLDIQTAPVREEQIEQEGSVVERKVVPYSAVIYDAHGDTWVYTNPKPRSFIRHSISIQSIKGDLVVLTDGPPSGMAVVTVGAAELFGVEFEIGH